MIYCEQSAMRQRELTKLYLTVSLSTLLLDFTHQDKAIGGMEYEAKVRGKHCDMLKKLVF